MSRHFFCFALYREPGSNRHAHHWAKDFKSFLSTNSNIAAGKSGAKVLLFFELCKFFCDFCKKSLIRERDVPCG